MAGQAAPASTLRTFYIWLLQTKPLIYPNKKKAILCFIFLCIFSLVSQAIRWAIPSLQIAGLQCSSCGQVGSDGYDGCIEHCLPLSDVQMGALSGPSFTVTMTIAAIPAGFLADRVSRVRLIWMMSLAWSIAALAIAVSDGFWELVITCMMIGLSISVVNPVAFSLLADYFPPENRSFVISAFSAVIFLGYDAGLATSVLGQTLTWRWAFALLGVPGLVLFLPALAMREPARGLSEQNDDYSFQPLTDDFLLNGEDDAGFDSGKEPSVSDSIKQIFTSVPFLLIWASATARLFGGFALGGWMPAFYRRVYGLEPWEVSIYLTVALTIGGLGGSYLGGYLSDLWYRRSKAGKIWTVLVSTLISIPFMVGMLLIPNVYASVACLLISSFFGEMWFGSAAAAVQDIVQPQLRSFATSIYLTGVGFGGISTVLVGWLNQAMADDAAFETEGEVSYDPTYPMLIVIISSYVVCSIGFSITGFLFLKKESNPYLEDASSFGHTLSRLEDDSIWKSG